MCIQLSPQTRDKIRRNMKETARVWALLCLIGYIMFCVGFHNDDELKKITSLAFIYVAGISMLVVQAAFLIFAPQIRNLGWVRKDWGRLGEFIIFLFVQYLSGVPDYLHTKGSNLFSLAGFTIWCLGFERALKNETDLNMTSIASGITFSTALSSIKSKKYGRFAEGFTYAYPVAIGLLHFSTRERNRQPGLITLNTVAGRPDEIRINIPAQPEAEQQQPQPDPIDTTLVCLPAQPTDEQKKTSITFLSEKGKEIRGAFQLGASNLDAANSRAFQVTATKPPTLCAKAYNLGRRCCA